MPASFQEVLQEFKDAEEPEQLEQWRQGGHAARKVKMLQQRARSIAEDWLEYYRKATGTSFLSSGSGLGLIHPNVMFFSPFRGSPGGEGGITTGTIEFLVESLSKTLLSSPSLARQL